MKNKTINTILIILVCALLATLAFFVRFGATADKVLILQAEGMTWGGCVANVEKALQSKGGVASVEVEIEGGWIVVGYDSKKIRPDEIATTIADLGCRNKVLEVLSIEQFRAKTGREPGIKMRTIGCAGGCGTQEAKGE